MFRASLAAVLMAALALSACGRKGPLEAPSTGSIAAEKTSATPDAGSVKPDKPFLLDPLI